MASEAELIQAAREYREAGKAHKAAVAALAAMELSYNNAHAAVTSADEAWRAAAAKLRDIAAQDPVTRGREFI